MSKISRFDVVDEGDLCSGSVADEFTRPRDPKEPHGPCAMGVLPDELLVEIFSYVPPKRRECRSETTAVPFVSRRWNRLYAVIIYSKIAYFGRTEEKYPAAGLHARGA